MKGLCTLTLGKRAHKSVGNSSPMGAPRMA